MIGPLVLAIAVAWLFMSAKIARHAASQRKTRLLSSLVGVAVFIGMAALPFLDELVGRWQFQRLCAAEGTLWVSPTAKDVVAAKDVSAMSDRPGFIFPITEQSVRYADKTTGKVFYSFKSFHTPGGLMLRAGLGLGNSTSCWPDRWMSKDLGLDIDEMMKRGKE